MAKMMRQSELLTKHVMSAPAKVVNFMVSQGYDQDESKALDEEILYLANYSGCSHPAYQRQGVIQGWNDCDQEKEWHDRDGDRDYKDKEMNYN